MSRTMVLSKWTLLGAVAILVLALVLTFAAVRVASADPPSNLVFNGDFSLGNVGFTSDYTFSPGDIVGEKTYDIVTDPSNSHPLATSYGDHTSGTGFMFAANGSTANGDVVWSQTINVTPNQNYIFSVFHSAWSSGTTAVLGIRINGTVLDLDFLDTGSSPGVWSEEDRFVFYSGNSSTATIDLVNSFAGAAGRDFALDDISVTEIESPHSLEEIQDLATELAIAQADANLQPCIDALPAFGLPPFLVDIICNGGHDSAVSQAANHTGSVWEGFFWPLAQNPDLHPHEVPNVPPDCDNAGPSQDILWPPNHKFHSINVVGVTDADGDTVIINIDSISQDEPVNGKGDGNTSPDGQGVGTDTAEVRAERSGTKKAPGDGRVYHISFTASDGNGGSCSGEVTVGSTS